MTTIKLKNGSGAPLAGDLVQGEPALDLTNKRLYTENSSGTVIEVGVNPTSVTTGNITATGTATFAGLTTTADVSFGDNDKAVFGAGADLQIYHDGSNSYISETGTGNLIIGAGAGVFIKNKNLDENLLSATQNGSVQLFYDNAEKLATTSTGIDVTGTVVSDGLTVDGDILVNRTSAFTNAVIEVQDDGDGEVLALNNNGTDGQFLRLYNSGTLIGGLGNNTNDVSSLNIYRGSTPAIKIGNATGDISFYEDTGTTAQLFWDASAERLGIGTSSPTDTLSVGTLGSGGNSIITIGASTSGTSSVYFGDGASAERFRGYFDYVHSSDHLAIGTAAVERMRIDSSGNVGIGVVPVSSASPTWQHIQFGGTGNLVARKSDTTVDTVFASNYYVNASEQDTYITTGAAARMFINDNVISFDQAASGSAGSAISFSEAMRIDASGNLLVGQSSTTTPGTGNTTTGISLRGGDGAIHASRSGNRSLYANRSGTDGPIISAQKDGVEVGSIGSVVDEPYFVGGNTGFRIVNSSASIVPAESDGTNRNAAIDLGASGASFKDLYLSGGAYLGGTGSANKLDDYEEGTFTPTVAGDASGAFSTAEGTYTKVGRLVFIEMYVVVSTNFASNYIGGLPFTVGNLLSGTSLGQSAVVLTNAADTVTGAAVEASGNMRFFNDHSTGSSHNPNTTNGGYRLALCYQV